MGQKGQRSDTHTLTHEAQTLTRDVVTAPFRLRTYRLIRKILIGFILVSIANVLFSYFFYTPKMYRIIRENRDLVIKYRILQDRIRTAQRHVDEIRHRDNYVYRSLFSTDTMSIEGVWQPYPDTKYAALLDDDYAPLMVGTWRQLDALADGRHNECDNLTFLYVYLRAERNIAATARLLNMHRNGATYRINRIMELLGLDLDNADTRLRIMISYEILKKMGKFSADYAPADSAARDETFEIQKD